MATIETPAPLHEAVPAAPLVAEAGRTKGWKPLAIVADIATLGTGTLLAGLFNVALVFVVPKVISVEDYGYWRMFCLYAGYVGFLHFGFADGALLRWAGRLMAEFHHEIGPALKYLFWQHVAVLALLGLFAAVALHGPLRFVGTAVVIYAPLYNIAATLQFALQGARIFRPVAISVVAPPALLLGFVLLWASRWPSGSRDVIGLYLLACCVQLGYLLAWTKPWSRGGYNISVKLLAKNCIRRGWPIVLANTGVSLIQYADRLAASWAATIQNFAQYSLAASAMALPFTAIQACSKVFFSYLAGVPTEGRKRIYGISSRVLLMAWVILLPYYFALGVFIHRFLPRYVPSLGYARVLLMGVPFLAAIQILQMSYAYLNGTQKQFLGRTVVVLGVALGVSSLVAFGVGSLWGLAAVQVAILGAWWLFNEWTLRTVTGQTMGDWMRFAGIYAWAGVSYWLTSGSELGIAVVVGLYYLSAAVIAVVGCRDELRLILSEITQRHELIIER
jgi:O-antigen/teichoic acid export membrane protein